MWLAHVLHFARCPTPRQVCAGLECRRRKTSDRSDIVRPPGEAIEGSWLPPRQPPLKPAAPPPAFGRFRTSCSTAIGLRAGSDRCWPGRWSSPTSARPSTTSPGCCSTSWAARSPRRRRPSCWPPGWPSSCWRSNTWRSSARYPDGGGVVSVASDAFGPMVGCLGGILICVDYFLTGAISSVSGFQYLAGAVPGAGPLAGPLRLRGHAAAGPASTSSASASRPADRLPGGGLAAR